MSTEMRSPQGTDLRLLYAHGFASSPDSNKGRRLAAHLQSAGRTLLRLDLRVPHRDRLRLSAMVNVVCDSIGDAPRVLAMGSSLGGLTVSRAAERDSRIVGVVLLAPAFRLVSRWRARMGDVEWAKWKREGTLDVDDHASKGKLHVDFGFIEDASVLDGDDAPDDALAARGQGPRWPRIDVPVIIVQGIRDETVDPELSRTFAKSRSNVRLVEVDDDHQLLSSMPTIEAEVDAMIARLG